MIHRVWHGVGVASVLVGVIGTPAIAASVATDTSPAAANMNCWRLASDLKRGDILTTTDVVPSPCQNDAGQAFRIPSGLMSYDRASGFVRLERDASQGLFLGRIRLAQAAIVKSGQAGVLRARVGAVEVTRTVGVQQSGHHGSHVFVAIPGSGVVTAIVIDDPSAGKPTEHLSREANP